MNCIRCEERISDYLDCALDVRESSAMDLHFAACPACTELLSGVRDVIAWGRTFPAADPSPWLAQRIVAATPQVVRETWLDTLTSMGRWILEPRTAMGIFTATLVLSWLGSLAGVDIQVRDVVRDPGRIYYQAEGFLNRAYGEAVQRYYKTPLISQIQFQLERLREIS